MTKAERSPYICVLIGGPEYIMDTSKGRVRFEMHNFCGPLPCDRHGNGRELPARHPFWDKVTRWVETGKKVENGHCIVPPRPICVTCGGTGTGERVKVGRIAGYRPCQDCGGTGSEKPQEP